MVSVKENHRKIWMRKHFRNVCDMESFTLLSSAIRVGYFFTKENFRNLLLKRDPGCLEKLTKGETREIQAVAGKLFLPFRRSSAENSSTPKTEQGINR
jgi:hypothetical protein